jgi:glycosyltransferase involved in cell wall biosynthesis
VIDGLFSHGGTPIKLLNLVKYSDRNQFRHVFLAFANQKENLNQAFREAGAIVVEVDRRRNWDMRLLWDIIGTARRCKANMISTHFARADIYGAIAGMLTRTPVIKNVHGMLWNGSRWLQRIDAALSRFRASTVCNSNATRNAVIRQTGAENTIVIYNGVPDHAVSLSNEKKARVRNSLGIPKDAFVIGHVGGLIPLRDQNLILSALKRLLDSTVNAYLVFVGNGPLREALEIEASRLNITKRVSFLGYRDDVPMLLSIFDVYVNMAREEGFGIAVVEAMQAGLPVVLANAGALPELIEDGISGFLVPPGDHESLYRTLSFLSSNRQSAINMGHNAKLKANKDFSIDRYVRDYEQLYISILSHPPRFNDQIVY